MEGEADKPNLPPSPWRAARCAVSEPRASRCRRLAQAGEAVTRSLALSIALLALVDPEVVLGAPADNGAICRQKRLRAPGLICPGDPEGPEAIRPEAQHPCRPWNMDALRRLYVFGDAEQRAGAEKAINDIWAGRGGWCPVR
jgi:hypothetical protein